MELTGNPFVDTGLMVLTALAEKDDVDSLSFADLRQVFGAGEQLARDNQRLKCFTMVFGTNGPLTQPAYKKAGKNEQIYRAIIGQLLDCAEKEGKTGPRCDLTGVRTDFDFQAVCAKALGQAGLPVPEQKWLGRDWIPLGGSLGNDAQALPGASRPLHVSALALFVLQYLPLGVFLFKGKLTCYQSTATALTQALVSDNVTRNQDQLSQGGTEILGKGAGTGILLDRLMSYFESVQDVVRAKALPDNTELSLWLFSNSGTGADCRTEQVPENAIRFVYEAGLAGFNAEIRRLLINDGKDPRWQLFECIRSERDYPGLYPFKKWAGASPEFYELYQREIRNVSPAALAIARKLAALTIHGLDAKRLKEVKKSDFINTASGRNLVRKLIVDNLSVEEYDALFPSQHHPVRIDPAGWQLLRFYLSRQDAPGESESITASAMKTTHPKIIQIAEIYRNVDPKKIENLLGRMSRRTVGISWLQDEFCRLAKKYPDFNLGDWDEFVSDDEGNFIGFELFFQLRLYLANLYREVTQNSKKEVA
jgi:hypothetical protein